MCWWPLASMALLKAPNCVVQLQKQFSSFVSKKHKAALQSGQVGVWPSWQYVALIRGSTGRTTPDGLADAELDSSVQRTPGEQRAAGEPGPGRPKSTDDGKRRPDLGTGSPVSWVGTRLESGLFHGAQWV